MTAQTIGQVFWGYGAGVVKERVCRIDLVDSLDLEAFRRELAQSDMLDIVPNHGGWQLSLSTEERYPQSVLVTARLSEDTASFSYEELVEWVTKQVNQLLGTLQVAGRVEAVFFCPHAPDEECRCRMPSPGLFEQIAERYGISLQGVPMAGDSLRDLQAGHAAGCEPHLVLTGLGAEWRDRPLPDTFPPGTRVHADVGAFADHLIARDAERQRASA